VEHAASECLREGRLELDLAELQLRELPAGALARLPWLHVLDLSRNELQAEALFGGGGGGGGGGATALHAAALPDLRSLSACHNALVGPLPPGLGALAPCLEELSLEGNLITALPAEAAALGAAGAPGATAAPVFAEPPASPDRITPRAVAVTIATPHAINRRYKAITTTEPVRPNSSATIE
jgi:Leucine-rich repeat (LRR) protein